MRLLYGIVLKTRRQYRCSFTMRNAHLSAYLKKTMTVQMHKKLVSTSLVKATMECLIEGNGFKLDNNKKDDNFFCFRCKHRVLTPPPPFF
jgi:hypothetical protein